MTARTFTNTTGGTWDVGTNWTGGIVPGSADVAVINMGGTYTVTLDNVQSPDRATLDNTSATLSITSAGQLLLDDPVAPVLALDAGTLVLAGILNADTIINNGAGISMTGGTLDGVVWDGLLDDTVGTFGSINIKDGITVNGPGSTPGTIDIGTLYMVTVMDANTLDNLTIAFGNYNNEYLNGSQSLDLILGSNGTIVQSAPTAIGEISGLEFDNHGLMTLSGSGATFLIESTTFNNLATVAVTADHVDIGNTFDTSGTVAIGGAGEMSIQSSTDTASNTGTISITSAGTLVSMPNIVGTGEITLKLDALADVHNVTGTVVFQDGKDTLRLEAPGSYTGAIAGFQKGDKIDLPGQTVTTLDPVSTTGSTTLNVLNGSTTIAALNLLGDYSTGYSFGFSPDGGTGFNITVACYATGARILTDRGEVAAGSLCEGDLLATAHGALKPLRWIGRSRIDLARHPCPEGVAPIRIRAGAFAPGLPHRDLLVSPDHAVFAAGNAEALIPARYLVNGSTIVREAAAGMADYVHLELDRHDVLLAEGLPAESYLDTGNRAVLPVQEVIRLRL